MAVPPGRFFFSSDSDQDNLYCEGGTESAMQVIGGRKKIVELNYTLGVAGKVILDPIKQGSLGSALATLSRTLSFRLHDA